MKRRKVKQMTKRYKLLDVFPEWLTSGIFSRILTLYPERFEWLDATLAPILDIEYFGNYSGGKIISVLLDKFVDEDNETISSDDKNVIAQIIVNLYGDKWAHLYDAITAEYNPINNYDMTQTETPNITKTNKAKTKTTINNDMGSKTYGFNSSEGVPQADTSTEATQTVEGDLDVNKTNNIETETGTRTLTRSGNIGVTTSQQMIESEISLRQWNFYKSCFDDIDDVMTARYYL